MYRQTYNKSHHRHYAGHNSYRCKIASSLRDLPKPTCHEMVLYYNNGTKNDNCLHHMPFTL